MMGEKLNLRTFGSFEAQWAGTTLKRFESDKARALLAYLAFEADHPHRRETLTGLLWPESPEKLARHSLSQALHSLRSVLGDGEDFFKLTPQSVQFIYAAGVWLDARVFQEHLQRVAAHCPGTPWVCPSCVEALELAVALYRGEFLAGFSLAGCQDYESWLCVQRESLQLALVKALKCLAASLESQGALERALPYAQRLVVVDPFNEAAQRQVLNLQAALGQRHEALQQYHTFKNYLVQELGIEPEPETNALYQQILETTERPPPAHLKSNLPIPLTPILGRQAELDVVVRKLRTPECRLLTLLGPGGIGKTRLALEAGQRLLRTFPDGVFLVDLDTQGIEKQLLAVIARWVGLKPHALMDLLGRRQATNLKEQLVELLSSKSMLLLLDGFESVLDQARLISDLLRRAPGVKVLATSRARLNLKSEHVLRLEGLACPSAGDHSAEAREYPSVNLFLQTTRRIFPEFSPDPVEMEAVVGICRLSQGLPLGILLASAWAGTLSPSQILSNIQGGLDFLSAGWSDLPERQHNLRAAFDHSWQGLHPALQQVFLHLAVFAGTFSAGRAWQVAGATLPQLKTLSDHSLLLTVGEGHFRLHNLLRQYALEKLASLPEASLAVSERHSRVFLEALAAWEPRLKSRAQIETLSEMDAELADIQAAWDWAASLGSLELLQNGARALEYYYSLRGEYPDGVSAFQRALAHFPDPDLSVAHRLVWANLSLRLAFLLFLSTAYSQAQEIAGSVECCLDLVDSEDKEVVLLRAEVSLVRMYIKGEYQANLQEALELGRQSLAGMRIYGDPWYISRALLEVSVCQAVQSNKLKTVPLAQEALAYQQHIGDPKLTGLMYLSLLYIYTMSGLHEKAIPMAHELDRYYQRVNTRLSRAVAAMQLGVAYTHAMQYDHSRPYLELALSLFDPKKNEGLYIFSAYLRAFNDLVTGNYAAVWSAFPEYGVGKDGSLHPTWRLLKGYLHLLDSAYDLAEPEIQSFLAHNRSLHRLDVLGHGLALLSYSAYRTGRLEEAHGYLVQALENSLEQGYCISLMMSLLSLSLILAEAEEIEGAVELFTLVSAQFPQRFPLIDALFGDRILELASALPAKNQPRSRLADMNAAAQYYLEKLKSSRNLHAALADTTHT